MLTDTNLLTQKEAAAILHTTVGTLNVWRHHGRGNIPYMKFGSKILYRRSDIENWILSNMQNLTEGEQNA